MTDKAQSSIRTALLGFVLAALIQVVAVAYWGGGMKQKVDDIDHRLERMEQRMYGSQLTLAR